MSLAVTVLLLDVMDTLVRDPFYEAIPAFFDMEFEQMLELKDPEAWPQFERGWIDETTFLSRFFRDRRTFEHAALRAHVQQAYEWVPGMRELLAELGEQDLAMHVLSNYPSWYRMIEQRLGLSHYVPWSFVSCETGWRKPEPEAFTEAAGALGVSAETCVVIDDRAANCDVARKLGMDAVRFEGVPLLREALRARGLLDE